MDKITDIPGVGIVKPFQKGKLSLEIDEDKLNSIASMKKMSQRNTDILHEILIKKIPVREISKKYNVSRNWIYVLKRSLIKQLDNTQDSPKANTTLLFKATDFAFPVFPSILTKMNALIQSNTESPHPQEFKKGMKDAMIAFDKKELTSPLNCKEHGETKLQRYRHGYNAVFKIIHG